jgi:peptidoglycan/LPS O-acetylase OafA/YrhL
MTDKQLKSGYIYEFDFIRVICAIGIICYHFMTDSGLRDSFPSRIGLFYAGDVFVTVFFALSGAALYCRHREVDNWAAFYKKRWLAIFPSFYIAYGLFYLILTIRSRAVLFQGIPAWRFILTVIGMDGYLTYRIPDFYILGEWFTGALIILYLLYPLLVRYKRALPYVFTAAVFAYLFSINHSVSGMDPFRTVSSCLVSFLFGMGMMKFIKSRIALAVSVLTFLFLSCSLVPISDAGLAGHLAGFSLIVILYHIGTPVERSAALRKVNRRIGGLTYQVFLVQHIVIDLVLAKFGGRFRGRVLLMMAIALSFFFAVVVRGLQKLFPHFPGSGRSSLDNSNEHVTMDRPDEIETGVRKSENRSN